MKRCRTLDRPLDTDQPVWLAIGMFDGVHVGHQQLIQSVVRQANENRGQAWVMTFDRHPLHLLNPTAAPGLIVQAEQKEALLRDSGLAGVMLIPFTTELASLNPEDFADRLATAVPTLHKVVVGADWRFARGATGTPETLRELGHERGFEVDIVDPVLQGTEKVSSTRIRAAISDGRLGDATAMLGRPYQISGCVIHGDQEGRTLGYPTANVDVVHDLLPPPGIYAVRIHLNGGLRDAAGYRSTVRAQGGSPVFEVHLFDWSDDLYGQTLKVDLLERVREDRRFTSKEALMRQIEADMVEIHQSLGAS